MKKYAIVITVYKNRYTHLLEHFNELNSIYDIYIVTQTNDPNKCDYQQYCIRDNIKVLYPDLGNNNSSIKAIALKRKYILEYMYEHKYDGYIMIDDDIKFEGYKITEESKRKTSNSYQPTKIHINEVIEKIINVNEEVDDAGMITLKSYGFMGLGKPGLISKNSAVNPAQFLFINPSICIKNNINYDTSGFISEDYDLAIKMALKGVNIYLISDYSYKPMADCGRHGTTIWKNWYNELQITSIHLYIKHHIPLKLTKNKIIHFRVNWRKLFNKQELPIEDKELYNLCLTENIEEIKKYLMNK